MVPTHEHCKASVDKLSNGQMSEAKLVAAGISLDLVKQIFQILVDEGGLTWNGLLRIIALLAKPPVTA